MYACSAFLGLPCGRTDCVRCLNPGAVRYFQYLYVHFMGPNVMNSVLQTETIKNSFPNLEKYLEQYITKKD